MMDTGGEIANTWSLVLAAGEGSRLRSLTTRGDGSVPKQFCSLRGGPSLLHEALTRAGGVAEPQRTCVVIAEQHRRWWEMPLRHLPQANLVVQPCNRGTGHGILLPLLHLLERDPAARLVIFPSDHHVRQEPVLAGALRRAIDRLSRGGEEILLLGLEPEQTDPELGYIVPGNGDGRGTFAVRQFVEKPPQSAARELIAHGALWNAFIIASSARALLSMFLRCAPRLVHEMRAAVRSERATAGRAGRIAELYARLPQLDFSRHVLPGQEQHLRVLRVPHCGWNDLGTVGRVAEALRGASHEPAYQDFPSQVPEEVYTDPPPAPLWARGYLNLAAQFEALRARPG